MKYLFGFFFLLGCTTPKPAVYLRNPLVKQILAPMIGFKTLTNVSQNEDGSLQVEQYDLNSPETRKTLRQLDFRCSIGGINGYYICAGGPGFCRREDDTVTGSWFFKKRQLNFAEVIDINERYQYLLDAKTRCESARVEEIN